MKKLLDFVPVDILPCAGGIICVQKRSDETGADKLRYILCDLQKKEVNTSAGKIYYQTKFGDACREIALQLADPVNCSAARISGGRTAVVYPNGETGIFDKSGKLLWADDLLYNGFPISGAAAEGGSVWAVVRKGNAVVKYSTSTHRFALRFGSKDSYAFSKPHHIARYEKELFISCPGINAVKTIDLKTFEVDEYCRFKEPVFKFMRTGSFEIVVLSSGVYVL